MTTDRSNVETQEFRLRLQNCLQTILDLKEHLGSMPYARYFLPEFCSLESFLSNLEHIPLDEVAVRRIELATDRFLNELGMLMKNTPSRSTASTVILQ